MRTSARCVVAFLAAFLLQSCAPIISAQSVGNSGTISGTITDPSGAVVAGATVTIENPVSQYSRSAATDKTGHYQFPNVPFNPYHMTVTMTGFSPFVQDVDVRSVVTVTANIHLTVGGGSSTVTVEAGGDLIEDDPTFHTDVDRDLFNKVPLESASSTLSSLVTLSTPGVAADSNGLFHGLGDHASNSFSVDGQEITDQQSKIFSNQLPSNAVQSIEVISGAPPAEYGGKTSLVIVATTRSGQGITHPTGQIYGSYGTFGSATGGFDLSYGGKNWGNFLEGDALNTGRFLDPPEFQVFHDKGNEGNIFDRIDYAFTPVDSVHLDLNYSRSWFQTPNAFDNMNVENVVSGGTSAAPVFGDVGNADQHSKIGTFNIAPTYTHVISRDSVANLTLYARKDQYFYYPSANPLQDQGPLNLQTSSISQGRTLFNVGGHGEFTYTHGHNNVKAGIEYDTTFLREHDYLGVVNPEYNSPCVDPVYGNPLPGFSDPSQCVAAGDLSNDPSIGGTFNPVLLPYDLTRGGSEYGYFGHADIKQFAMYVEDELHIGNWTANLGMRGDLYNGLAISRQPEPRVGMAYNIKPSATVLSVSYARTLETPFNENLVLSSQGCSNAVLAPLLLCNANVAGTLEPGFRNEFHASIQQAISKHAVVSGEYIWKYTHNAFDFSILGNTPITFPIDWHNSKIPGYAIRAEVPQEHGFSAYFVTSSVAARFFPPQVAGAGATSGVAPGYPFRIDHDEKFNETTHLQYTLPGAKYLGGLWGGFNWRYDSGLVAGSTPCYGGSINNTPCGNSTTTLPDGSPGVAMVDNNIPPPPQMNLVTGAPIVLPLTADQEFQAGFICNGQRATPGNPLPAMCPANEFSSSLLRVPAPGTGDNDHNPPRVAPRNLFDLTVGKNNIFHREHYKTDLDLSAINLTNKYALYNFLSTFSGTHYVTPQALTGKITLNF
jgi:Carboxypeptidase regulatory-like domain/TonB-dependent Receptor Plug Domain